MTLFICFIGNLYRMTQYIIVLGAFIVSALCGFISIPAIQKYCKDKNLYDIPNQRKVHHCLVPRLGGISFLPSMVVAFIIALLLLGNQAQARKVEINLWSLYFMVSLLIIYTTGIIDDIIGLSANIKFVMQIVAASILPLAGLYINNLYGLFGFYEIPYYIGCPLTVFTIVFIDNAMNLIDGIDGLCASLSLMALTGFLFCFWREGLFIYCVLIAGLMGVLIPYLYHNIFGTTEKGNKIFMGDSGSLTLGFILGFLFVKFVMDNRQVMPFCEDRMCMVFSLIIIPVFDVVRVICYRLIHHKPIFDADKNHIHHKLMATGMNQHKALLTILGLALGFICLNFLMYNLTNITIILLADIAIYTLFNILVNLNIKKKK